MRYKHIVVIVVFFCWAIFGAVIKASSQTKNIKVIKIELLQADKKTALPYFGLTVSFGSDSLKSSNLLSDAKGFATMNIPVSISEIRLSSSSTVLQIDTIVNLNTLSPRATIVCTAKYIENQLSQVTVTAGHSTIYTADKISYKASDFKVPDLPIAKNLLTLIPSISRIDNNYKVDGNFDPVFYINGSRVLYLAVENLPIATIDRVEIIKNASITSGLKPNQVAMNIVTKKNPQTILGGMLSANNSFTQRNFGGFSTLYLTGKKFFVNLMLNSYSAGYDVSSESEWLDKTNNGLIYSRAMQGESSTVPKIGTLSANYDINEKLQLNYSLSYNNIRAKQHVSSLINQGDVNFSNENLNSLFRPLTVTNFANLNIKLSKESNLFFRATHNFSSTLINLDLENQTAGLVSNASENKVQDFNFLIGHDFKMAKAAIEIGGLFQYNQNRNNFKISSPQSIPVTGNLDYDQIFYAVYAKLRYPFRYFTLTLTNRLDLNLSMLNGENLKNRLQYLPSLSVYIPTKENGTFSLSASRQAIFPGSDDLAENQRRQTLGVISTGAQTLNQQINWNFSANHNLSGETFELTNALNYEFTRGLIAFGPYLNSGVNIQRTKLNVDEESVLSYRPGINLTPSKRISFTAAIFFGYYSSIAEIDAGKIENSGFFIAPSLNIVQTNPKFVNLNFVISYRNVNYLPFEIKKQQAPAISLSISRSFLKKSLTVTTSVYDALNTSNNSVTSGISPKLYYNTSLNQPMRSIGISISYLFHSKAFRYSGNTKGIKGRETKAASSN